LDWLAAQGIDVGGGGESLLATEHRRPAAQSLTTFTTDQVLDWLAAQPTTEPWFAHVSYLRPHPPYSAPGEWSQRYDPATLDERAGPPIAPQPAGERSAFHDAVLGTPLAAAPTDPAALARLRAQYFGNVSHVDHELGRV
ncbi:MAG TPA: sulfatase-like hydrolase/transferase, partial [Ilumatobacteraceae bacterium]|nr:sulfatase-like hydrolase/transferase [Ilumatobacteraceae bacterium]